MAVSVPFSCMHTTRKAVLALLGLHSARIHCASRVVRLENKVAMQAAMTPTYMIEEASGYDVEGACVRVRSCVCVCTRACFTTLIYRY